MTTTKRRCYCPGDCNCRIEWRPTYCGCRCADKAYTFTGGTWTKTTNGDPACTTSTN